MEKESLWTSLEFMDKLSEQRYSKPFKELCRARQQTIRDIAQLLVNDGC